jgi:hypothetical protein
MDKTMKQKLLDAIGRVYEKSEACDLSKDFFKQIHPTLLLLSEYFRVPTSQSFFIAIIFAMNYHGRRIDFNDLIRHFNCNPMKLLSFSDDIEALLQADILVRERTRRRRNTISSNDEYRVSERITEAILKNQPMPTPAEKQCKDIVDLFEMVAQLAEDKEEQLHGSSGLFFRIKELLDTNMHFPFIEWLNKGQFENPDLMLFLLVIWNTLSGKRSSDMGNLTGMMFDNPADKVRYMQKIVALDNELMAQELLEIEEGSFFNDLEVRLSEKSLSMLEKAGLKLFSKKKRHKDIIDPATIAERKLIFNCDEARQVSMLEQVLKEDQYIATITRLKDKNLPPGIVSIFHGAPGTGKTETVLQLARKCGREICKVDISQSKSMWFGESEKIVKRIFTHYGEYAKECDRKPILLFNEADAIFSIRKDPGSSNVAQTENTIQNIILEELENFDGIFIATTNMIRNLDPAFERRFLFKIEFHKPGKEARADIWKLKLPGLRDDEYNTLAENFTLSGGQIDNICRKYEIHAVLYNTTGSFDKIMEFCREETLEQATYNPVGFRGNGRA